MTDRNLLKKIPIWTIFGGLGIVLGIIVSIVVIENRIEKIVSDKLKDPEVLRQVAYHLRPSLTFNQNGTILSDSGAQQFIKDITVEMGENEPKSIIISPKDHLNSAPVLECLNYNFSFSTKQVGKSDWQYKLSSPNYLVFEGPTTVKWIFRLEIIR